jgi:Membrane domain of glycerophosphoryl diester phosphodiesterase
MSFVAPSSPQSIGGILDGWLRLFRESFGRCWALAAVATLMAAILIFLVEPVHPPQAMTLWRQRLWLLSVLNEPKGSLASVLVTLISLLISGALLAAQVAVFRGRSLTFVAALTTGLSRFPRMLGGLVLCTVAAAGTGMAVGTAVAVSAGVAAAFALHPLTGAAAHAFGVAGAVIFIMIPAMYMFVRLSLWQPAIFAEGDSATDAIGRSWRLVKGHWWRTTAILFVAAVVIFTLGTITPLLVGLMLGVFNAPTTGLPGESSTLRFIQVLSQTTRVVTLPLATSISLTIYHDLKLRHESADLAAREGTPSAG